MCFGGCADQYNRVSPILFPTVHTPLTAPFFALPPAGGMPAFNEVFVFFFFHAFIKFSNMHDVFAIRNDQSYNSLLERKHKGEGDGVSEEYIINKYTIAYLNLMAVSSLDVSINMRRDKIPIYDQTVAVLKKMDGVGGNRNWRTELAEVLTKWHDTFKHVTKTKRDPTVGLPLSNLICRSSTST